MTATISSLLNRYESGMMTRRELIATITTLATTSTTVAAGLRVSRLDHLSLQVSDLRRSRDFYAKVFGATLNSTPRRTTRCDWTLETSVHSCSVAPAHQVRWITSV